MADVEDDAQSDPQEAEGGEEGGEEEGGEQFFPFSLGEFILKLREKPQLPNTEEEGCGASAPQKSYKGWSFPVGERLTVTTLTALDALKARIPLPKGCVPPLALPSWHYLPIEKKLPLVQAPKGLLYCTRGLLGQKLLRKPVVFSTRDPLNMERVIGGPYCALHDPHARDFLYSPIIRTLLLDQGFINDQNEVICSLREFNKFRDYLRTLYTDQIWKQFESGDALVKCEREQLKALIKSESHEIAGAEQSIRDARVASAKQYQAEAMEYRRRQAEQRDQMARTRLREWQLEKERKVIEHILKNIEDQKRNTARLQALYDIQLQRRRDIMTRTTRKFLETEERTRNDKAMMEAAYNKFLLEWIESKYVFCWEKVIQKKQLQQDLTGNLKYKARRRQRRLEKYREMMPTILEKKKAETARIWALVRKFAMRWLDKVRARLNAPKDLKHESCWIGSKNVLDDTVKYLYQESGYEKLDDFILNIMKLKKQIQHQIEMEEAEEAALAGGQDHSSDGGTVAGSEFEASSDK